MTTRDRVAMGARAAAAILGIGSETKNAVLDLIAKRLEEARADIELANRRDLEAAEKVGLSSPILKRLAFGERQVRRRPRGYQARCAGSPTLRPHPGTPASSTMDSRCAAFPAPSDSSP